MRNLSRYPVTTEEIVVCLTGLADEFASQQLMGDLRPELLRRAAEIVACGPSPHLRAKAKWLVECAKQFVDRASVPPDRADQLALECWRFCAEDVGEARVVLEWSPVSAATEELESWTEYP